MALMGGMLELLLMIASSIALRMVHVSVPLFQQRIVPERQERTVLDQPFGETSQISRTEK